jgi:hypothetical protein
MLTFQFPVTWLSSTVKPDAAGVPSKVVPSIRVKDDARLFRGTSANSIVNQRWPLVLGCKKEVSSLDGQTIGC